MNRAGVIYQYGAVSILPTQEAVSSIKEIRPPQQAPVVGSDSLAHKVFRGMFIGGLIGLIVLFFPLLYVEARYRVKTVLTSPEEEALVITTPEIYSPTFVKLINDRYTRALQPTDRAFSIVIPKLGINSKIVANVDASNKEVYTDALKQGAAHAAGTALPGNPGRSYIFAHSTDYIWNIAQFNAIFYLLRELEVNDQIFVVYQDTVFPYQVTDKKIIDPDDISYMQSKTGKEELVLQTCWPPGTTAKRLLVFAEPIHSMKSDDTVTYSH